MHMAALRHENIEGSYERIRVAPKNLGTMVAQLRRKGYDGLNVTIPHKSAIVSLIDGLDEPAQRIGAVNTVARVDGRFLGSNTDASGFRRVLQDRNLSSGNALILGAGGAARACIDVLLMDGWTVAAAVRNVDSRSAPRPELSMIDMYDNAAMQQALDVADLLVNATPIGMNLPDESPLMDRLFLTRRITVMDLVYSPLDTRLLLDAEDAGCPTIDGLALLAAQAADSFATWTGRRLSDEFFRQAAREGSVISNAQTFSLGQFMPPSAGNLGT
jgi:shikimate dehydrogenase